MVNIKKLKQDNLWLYQLMQLKKIQSSLIIKIQQDKNGKRFNKFIRAFKKFKLLTTVLNDEDWNQICLLLIDIAL